MSQCHRSGTKIIFRAINASFGGLFFGYCMGVLNFSQSTLNVVLNIQKDKQSFWSGIISAFLAFGALIGCILTPVVLSKMNRKQALILCDAIGIIGSVISQFADLPTFCMHRFCVGIATGMNSTIDPLYIKEFSPISFSGITGSIHGLGITSGIFISYVFGIGFGFNDPQTSASNYWRIVFLFPIILCTVRSIGFFTFYHEDTPLNLIQIGKLEESKKVLSVIYQDQYVDQMFNELTEESISNKANAGSFADLLKPGIKKRLYIGIMLQLLQQFCGINAVKFYSKLIFLSATGSLSLSYWLSLGFSFLQCIMVFTAVNIIKVVGRKTLLIFGDSIIIITQLCLGISSLLHIDYYPDNNALQILIIIWIYTYIIGFSLSLGPVVWLYNAEILPTKGITIATIANWSGVICITFLFPICESAFTIYPIFFFFSFYTFANIFLLIFQVKETKGQTSKQIEQAYLGITTTDQLKLQNYVYNDSNNIQDSDNIRDTLLQKADNIN